MIAQRRSPVAHEATTFRSFSAHRRIRHALLALGTVAALAMPAAAAQAQDTQPPPRAERIKLSGPRFGVTYLNPEIRDSISARTETDLGPIISQFGWQWEKQFNAGDSGPVAVSEWVFLVGGLEQGTFLPSLSWIVGLRTKNGTEFGVGPNLSAAGTALVIGAGVTRRAGTLNIPLNITAVPTQTGVRVSVLTGFTIR